MLEPRPDTPVSDAPVQFKVAMTSLSVAVTRATTGAVYQPANPLSAGQLTVTTGAMLSPTV